MSKKLLLGTIGTILGGPVGGAIGLVFGQAMENDEHTDRAEAIWLRSHNGYVVYQCPDCPAIRVEKASKYNDYWTCAQCKTELIFRGSEAFKNAMTKSNVFNKTLADISLFYLFGCIAGADKQVTEKEHFFIQNFLDSYGFSTADRLKHEKVFIDGFNTRTHYEYAASTLGHIFRKQEDVRRSLVLSFIRFAALDSNYRSPGMEIALYSVAHKGFGFSQEEVKNFLHQIMLENSENEQIDKSLADLESNSNMTFEEIKKNYYRLCKAYHPDTLTGKSVSPEIETLAKEKLQRINEAFEVVSRHSKYRNAA